SSAPRWLCVVGTPLIATPAILSGSRGGLAAFLLAVIAFGIFAVWRRLGERSRHPHWLRRGWLRGSGAVAAFGVAIVFALLGVRDSWREINHTDLDKFKLAAWIVPLLHDFPLFGVGRGAFESAFAHYKPTADHLDFSYPENIAAQWTAEWGLVVGSLGLVTMLWLCRPSQLGFGRQMSVTGAVIGAFALLAQNLVDFSLELFAPMLALTVVIGCAWGQHRASLRAGPPNPSAARGLAVVALAFVATGLAGARGVGAVSTDRLQLQSEYTRLASKDDVVAIAALRQDLRAAMLRHPAEAYFPRLGAVLALRVGDVEPLPWISAALRRWEGDSRAHWILAQVLQKHGLLAQALLEARLAVEKDPELATVVGSAVAHWSTRLEDIELVALPGRPGAQVRLSAANALAATTYPELRGQLLGKAVAQDPLFAPAQWAFAQELLRLGEAGVTPDLLRATLARATALDRITPGSADGSMIRLRLYTLTDQPTLAVSALSERCPTLDQAERVRCWWALLSAAAGHQWAKRVAETAAQHYAKAACAVEDTCAPALSQAGDVMGTLGDWDLALGYFEQAVARDPTVTNLLRVADAATMLQRFSIAMHALSAVGARAGGNSALAARVEAQKQAILREAMAK
ncbi:MAG: O-antigen ligase family protein, partial [Polyangiaceae bacterium]